MLFSRFPYLSFPTSFAPWLKSSAQNIFLLTLVACSGLGGRNIEQPSELIMNPVSYFEIPVSDLDRAVEFYESVFDTTLESTVIDGNSMALFGYSDSEPGITGALALGESYTPSREGPRIYFSVANIDAVLEKVTQHGGLVAYPKTSIGDLGWVAEFIDSEGNQIALSMAP